VIFKRVWDSSGHNDQVTDLVCESHKSQFLLRIGIHCDCFQNQLPFENHDILFGKVYVNLKIGEKDFLDYKLIQFTSCCLDSTRPNGRVVFPSILIKPQMTFLVLLRATKQPSNSSFQTACSLLNFPTGSNSKSSGFK